MDPQHKIALEVSYRALEDAGLTLDDVTSSNTAVYMGELPEDVDVILCVTSLHCRDVAGVMNYDYLNLVTMDPDFADNYTPAGARVT